MIRVALFEDQPLVRAGISLLIDSQPDMKVVFQAADGDQACHCRHADVVLMDVQMPHIDGIRAISFLPTTCRVIMLTTFADQHYILGSIEAGASGYLLKDAPPEELLTAIRTVHDGHAVLSPKITAKLLRKIKDSTAPEVYHDIPQAEELTPREEEILRLIALGFNNQEIADHECVSLATVKTHVRHILMKTQSRDRVHAVLYAYKSGRISLDDLLKYQP
ncbi:response regulator [Corynebacterium poyangense]|uniref:Response regulator n=1 Tax=Corynebacterium poyangense TaxID=2684405 RepID=A0A7H0SPX9_9CORY|nr:response regulator transcription factor [Corynebacterium poyangense]MBZ8178471.1 response regulator [Corynebacterium poyangense]QNQ90604.1 response regulator [Corynebacterium poyangense]